MNFSKQLKELRSLCGLSQQDLSDRILVPKKTIQNWEIDKRTPPPYVQRFIINELESLAKE